MSRIELGIWKQRKIWEQDNFVRASELEYKFEHMQKMKVGRLTKRICRTDLYGFKRRGRLKTDGLQLKHLSNRWH